MAVMNMKWPSILYRSDSTKSQSSDVFPLPVSQDKAGNSGAIVKSSNELTKTTPAGEYLTSALMDFDPNQFEGVAAIADGANKLLMLVSNANIECSFWWNIYFSIAKYFFHILFPFLLLYNQPYFHCHCDYNETPPISDWRMVLWWSFRSWLVGNPLSINRSMTRVVVGWYGWYPGLCNHSRSLKHIKNPVSNHSGSYLVCM